jgi:hypothetical protein
MRLIEMRLTKMRFPDVSPKRSFHSLCLKKTNPKPKRSQGSRLGFFW